MLAGEPMARPDGLERALVRAGYEVGELELGDPVLGDGPAPDALVATAPHVEALTALLQARDARWPGVPLLAPTTTVEWVTARLPPVLLGLWLFSRRAVVTAAV